MVTHQGQIEATIRATSAREAAKEYFTANPSRQTCSVGEPGRADVHRFDRGAGFDHNHNRIVRKTN